MASLKEQSYELATGDPVACGNCQGILNMFSLIEIDAETGKQVWNCDFCSHKNIVDIDPEEKPKSETVSYIIEAAPVAKEEEKKSKDTSSGLNKDISIVYCVDVSGSMAGSRLTAVQKTIMAQIKEMAENHSERKIGIVTFTDNV